MLLSLGTRDIGPARELDVEFAPRLNALTGDNGLGKSFLLDIAWWALTRCWSGQPAHPREARDQVDLLTPQIRYRLMGRTGPAQPIESDYDFSSGYWPLPPGAPPEPGLVVYARLDGGFSVWDRLRNDWQRWQKGGITQADPLRPPSFQMSRDQLWWTGLSPDAGRTIFCNGLLRDWVDWQQRGGDEFHALTSVLDVLSPSHREQLRPGPLTRISMSVRDIPTLDTSYGRVPVVFASAAVQRILGLAYLLVWAWYEHRRAAAQARQNTSPRLVLLIDEVEAHLHPQWQRAILPALLRAISTLQPALAVQVILTTHSPLVLASIEPLFDEAQDRLFLFNLGEDGVHLESLAWAKHGSVTNWLTSEIFGLEQARSLEAERVILAANALMRGDHSALPEDLCSHEQIHARLLQVLPGDDVFWPRWVVYSEKQAA